MNKIYGSDLITDHQAKKDSLLRDLADKNYVFTTTIGHELALEKNKKRFMITAGLWVIALYVLTLLFWALGFFDVFTKEVNTVFIVFEAGIGVAWFIVYMIKDKYRQLVVKLYNEENEKLNEIKREIASLNEQINAIVPLIIAYNVRLEAKDYDKIDLNRAIPYAEEIRAAMESEIGPNKSKNSYYEYYKQWAKVYLDEDV
jgi:hypothetical protein